MVSKPDSHKIIEFLDNLAKERWLGPLRSHWVKYAFHHTEIRNAVEILKHGKLVSRSVLEENKLLPVDVASKGIISHTGPEIKKFVRLYFRPKTPTQFLSEGIRPKDKQQAEAHCPVPVFFLFDLKQILTLRQSEFAEGNLARLGVRGLCKTADALSKFEFKKIYHSERFSQWERDDIISHRNAEIVVPHELPLDTLRLIVCRSPAEKETLLNLLPRKEFNKWASKVLVDSKANLFNRRWTFIDTVSMDSQGLIISFSPDSETPQPFELLVTVNDGSESRWGAGNFMANSITKIKFKDDKWLYKVEVKLDENLAFLGSYDGTDDIPF